MKNNRGGIIWVSKALIEDSVEAVSLVFSQMKFVPVRAEFLFHRDSIEYTGFSPMFEEIQEGYKWPEYTIILQQDEDEIISVKEVNRVSSKEESYKSLTF